MKRTQWILLTLLVVVLIVCRTSYTIGNRSAQRSAEAKNHPINVQLDSVRHGSIKEELVLGGVVHPNHEIIIRSRISGELGEIIPEIGDYVQAHQIIAVIRVAEFRQEVFENEADLEEAKANHTECEAKLRSAEAALKRFRLGDNADRIASASLQAAESRVESARARLEIASARYKQAQAAFESALIRMNYTQIRSPQAGFIRARYVDPGSRVSPEQPLLTLQALDTVVVRSNSIENEYSRLEKEMTATATFDALPGRRFTGWVSHISLPEGGATPTATIEVSIPNDSLLLKPGMIAQTRIVLAKRDFTQIVPRTAILTRYGHIGLFRVSADSTTALWVPVQTGLAIRDSLEILNPPLTGNVIVRGQHRLQGGSRVHVSGDPLHQAR